MSEPASAHQPGEASGESVRVRASRNRDDGRAEAELERTRLLLEAILEQSPVPTVVASVPDEVIRYANRAALEFLGVADEPSYVGLTLSEVMARQTWRDLRPDGTPIPLMDLPLGRAARGELTRNEEYVAIRKDGTPRWELVGGTPIYDRNGALVAGLIVFPDITQQKQAEELLRAAEERWQFALEGAGDGVWDWNVQTNEVFLSPQWKAMLGYADHEIEGTLADWESRVHPDDLAHVRADLERHLSGQTATYVNEHRVRCKDGSWKWILDRGKVVSYAPDGRPLRIVGTHTDLTERKRAEEERLRLTAILESTSDLVSTCTPAGRVLYLNAAGRRLLGWSETEEAAAHTIRENHPAWACERIQNEAIPEAIAQGVWQGETAIRTHDGRELPVSQVILAHRDAAGEVQYFSTIARDISERKQAEEAMRESAQRYRNFVANASEGIYRIDFTEPIPIDLPPDEIVARIDRLAIVGEANEALARMYGLRAVDMIGRPATDFAPHYGERAALVLQRPNYQVVDEETVDRDAAGQPLYLSENYTGVVENGHLVRIWGVQRNISERKQAEEELRHHEAELRRQNDVLLHLMQRETLFGGELDAALAEITAAGAELLQTERVSVWWYEDEHRVIRCVDAYHRSRGEHTCGETLRCEDFPAYNASHLKGLVIAAEDVRTDPRTREIPTAYWETHDIHSLVDAPVWVHGRLGAVVCFEHVGERRRWTPDDERIASTLATLVSLCAESAERTRAEAGMQLNESRLEALLQLNQMTEANLTEIAEFAMEEGVRLTRSKLGYIAFVSEDESTMTMFAWSKGATAECAVQDQPVEYVVAETGLWGEAVRQRRPIITNDYAAPNPRKKGTPDGHVTLRRHMNVPVFDGNRIVLVAGVGNKDSDYDESDGRQLTLLMSGMWRIVQRKRAEEKLRESETRYRALFEAAGNAIFLLRSDNGQLHIVECNQRAMEMFGATREQVCGLPASRFWAPVQADGTPSLEAGSAHVKRVAEIGMVSFEWRHQRLDGAFFDADVVLTRVPFGAGRNLLAVVRDITERKQTEERLRLAEFSIEHSGLTAIWLDRQGRVVRVNEAACESLGYTREELLRMTVRDFDPEFQSAEKWNAAWDEVKRRGQFHVIESRHRHKDGYEYPVEVIASFCAFGDREYVFSTARDITERRRMEDDLRMTQFAMDRASDSIYWLDRDANICYANNASCKLLGYSQKELLSMSVGDVDPDFTVAHWEKQVREMLARGTLTFESHLYTKDGRAFPVEVTGNYFEYQGRFYCCAIVRDITERRKAEQALRDSEATLRSIFRAVPVAIGMVSPDRRFTFVNERTTEMTGYAPDELIGQSTRMIYADDEEYERIGRTLFEELNRVGFMQTEGHTRRKDGSETYTLINATRLHPDDPSAGTILTLLDISERKRTEQALQSRLVAMMRPLDDTATITFSDLFDLEEIQKLQDAFTASSGTAQLITAPDGTPITRPSGFCRLCSEFVRQSEKGRQRCHLSDAALGRVCIDGPTVRPCLSAGLWGAGASIMVGGKHVANWLIGQVRNESLDLEQIARYAKEIEVDPEEFRKALQEVPVMSEERFRNVAHTLYVLSNELSAKAYQNVQQARFIAERKQAEQTLRENAERLRLAMQAASMGTWEWDLVAERVVWSPETLSIFGISADEFGETYEAYLAFAIPETREEVDEKVKQFLSTAHEGAVIQYEHEIIRGDGQSGWVEVRGTTFVDSQGQPVRMTGICTDITARKMAERERAKLETQLRQSQKLEAIGQLAGGVAHDFNNILTAVFGNVELAIADLRAHHPEADGVLDGLQQIERSAQRASALTRQLLAFSRRQITRPEALDLNRTLRDLEKMLRRLITENITLTFDLTAESTTVRADPGQLEQVIVNLVVNARDAMPDGGTLTMETETVVLDESHVVTYPEARAGPHVVLAVSDTGCGMDRATLEHIFEPFFTTKPVGTGTGLGLSTVYGIVKQAGGHVTAYSEPDRGSTFRVYLPLLEAAAVVRAPQKTTEPPPRGTETVIVCEDDAPVRELTACVLRDAGYTVLAAAGPGEALELAADHAADIDLLITDVIMPDMNGRRLSEALLKVRPELQTLFVSGYTSNVIAHHGVLEKDVEFLEKPFSRRQLLQRVREVLDRVRSSETPR